MVGSVNEKVLKLLISGEGCRQVTTDSFPTEISENTWDFPVMVESCSATQTYHLPTAEKRNGTICI